MKKLTSPFNFIAAIEIIGVNPFVQVPDDILAALFARNEKRKGAIPIKGTVNGLPYTQTLIKFKGLWRLYVNTAMLKNSPKRVGEIVEVAMAYDESDRTITPPDAFVKALADNPDARAVFDGLPTSRRHEIVRYIAVLKTEEAVERNIARAIEFLKGNGRFVGRDKP